MKAFELLDQNCSLKYMLTTGCSLVGKARGWGSRDRRFKSSHPDQITYALGGIVMDIDPRLDEVDSCLYRVAMRALIVSDGKVLVVHEASDNWWAIPGGGIKHGEAIQACLKRELEEEMGVSASSIYCDYKVVHYSIGKVVNGVPRMNMYFRVSLSKGEIKSTEEVQGWRWCGQEEFLSLNMNPSYNKAELASVIFSRSSTLRGDTANL